MERLKQNNMKLLKYFFGLILRCLTIPLAIIWLFSSFICAALAVIIWFILGENASDKTIQFYLYLPTKYRKFRNKYDYENLGRN